MVPDQTNKLGNLSQKPKLMRQTYSSVYENV